MSTTPSRGPRKPWARKTRVILLACAGLLLAVAWVAYRHVVPSGLRFSTTSYLIVSAIGFTCEKTIVSPGGTCELKVKWLDGGATHNGGDPFYAIFTRGHWYGREVVAEGPLTENPRVFG
ncbi:MAG: hypothetical protein IMZ65_02715, partial [Planctomycetes bacterium]|nr:hypothetical protein [Planctomycetota bacterium]